MVATPYSDSIGLDDIARACLRLITHCLGDEKDRAESMQTPPFVGTLPVPILMVTCDWSLHQLQRPVQFGPMGREDAIWSEANNTRRRYSALRFATHYATRRDRAQ